MKTILWLPLPPTVNSPESRAHRAPGGPAFPPHTHTSCTRTLRKDERGWEGKSPRVYLHCAPEHTQSEEQKLCNNDFNKLTIHRSVRVSSADMYFYIQASNQNANNHTRRRRRVFFILLKINGRCETCSHSLSWLRFKLREPLLCSGAHPQFVPGVHDKFVCVCTVYDHVFPSGGAPRLFKVLWCTASNKWALEPENTDTGTASVLSEINKPQSFT